MSTPAASQEALRSLAGPVQAAPRPHHAGSPGRSDCARRTLVALVLCALAPALARAEQAAPPAPPSAPPAPYALPWQLRPVGTVTVLRLDDSLAFSEKGTTNVTFLTASYAFDKEFATVTRFGTSVNRPEGAASGAALVNAAVGGMYAHKLGDVRAALYLLVALPIGMGGGDTPDAPTAAAASAGILARSAMDNAMFAVDYFTVFPGLDVAWVKHGFTVQAEATVLQLTRVRGAGAPADESKTNLTTSLVAGWFARPELSLGAELRYQRWLSTPAAVNADPTNRDNLSAAFGVRGHIALGNGRFVRPGLAYARGLAGKLGTLGYDIVQFDVPVQF